MEEGKEYTFEEVLEMGLIPTYLDWQDKDLDYPRYLRDPQKSDRVYIQIGSGDKPCYQAFVKECINPKTVIN